MTTEFILELEKAIHFNKPGRSAQMLMSRFGRSTAEPGQARLASVLILLFLKNHETHFVLTKRTSTHPEDKHSGQISFPGGSKDPIDEDLQTTAIRETFEEIGVNADKIKIIGQLSDLYIPVSNFQVHPFVGYTSNIGGYKLQPNEVEEILEIPISMLLEDEYIKSKDIAIHNGMVLKDVPYFDFFGYTVWGATAMILSEFREVVKIIQAK